MKVERKIFLPLRLNIQQFAEDNGEGGAGAPKTYSEEEYNKIQAELSKYKASFDKASSDLAEEKRKAKAKMTEDEKKAQEDAEKEAKFNEMAKELQKFKLKSSLGKVFEGENLDNVVEAIVSNDLNKVTEIIVKTQEEFKTKTTEELKQQFSKSSKIPGGVSSDDDSDDDVIKNLAKKQSSKKASVKNDAWDKYNNR